MDGSQLRTLKRIFTCPSPWNMRSLFASLPLSVDYDVTRQKSKSRPENAFPALIAERHETATACSPRPSLGTDTYPCHMYFVLSIKMHQWFELVQEIELRSCENWLWASKWEEGQLVSWAEQYLMLWNCDKTSKVCDRFSVQPAFQLLRFRAGALKFSFRISSFSSHPFK